MYNIYTKIGKNILTYLFKFILFSTNFIFFIILYYLNNLEDETCKCVRDWRHNFVKYMSIILILPIFLYISNINITNEVYKAIYIYLLLLYIYVFYTYIGDLNASNCNCAVKKQKTLHYYLMMFYYIVKIIIYLVLFFLLVLLVSQLFH